MKLTILALVIATTAVAGPHLGKRQHVRVLNIVGTVLFPTTIITLLFIGIISYYFYMDRQPATPNPGSERTSEPIPALANMDVEVSMSEMMQH